MKAEYTVLIISNIYFRLQLISNFIVTGICIEAAWFASQQLFTASNQFFCDTSILHVPS